MAICHLCGERPPDAEMWEHLRVLHPDQWGDGPERWPDGEPVINDMTLDPSDFDGPETPTQQGETRR